MSCLSLPARIQSSSFHLMITRWRNGPNDRNLVQSDLELLLRRCNMHFPGQLVGRLYLDSVGTSPRASPAERPMEDWSLNMMMLLCFYLEQSLFPVQLDCSSNKCSGAILGNQSESSSNSLFFYFLFCSPTSSLIEMQEDKSWALLKKLCPSWRGTGSNPV